MRVRSRVAKEEPIRAGDTAGTLGERLAPLGAELMIEALDRAEAGALELTEQPEDGVTYADKIDPAERQLDPGRPAAELERVVRALAPAIGAYLELDEVRPARRRRRPCGGRPSSCGRARVRGGRLLLGSADGALELLEVKPAGGRAMSVRDYLRRPSRSGPRALAAVSATASRRVAHAVMRRVFEEGAYADRAFRAEADRACLGGRDRAFAMRLAYGAVQMKATLDFVLARVSSRPLEKLDPPVLAALRLGLYQALFMGGTPDRAAVDESVELVKRPSASAHGFVNAVLRRAVREGRRDARRPRRGDAGGRGRASFASPLDRRAVVAELGPAEARALMRGDNEPAESAVRVNELKVTTPSSSSCSDAKGWRPAPTASPEALVLERRLGRPRLRAFERGLLMPQSRASMLVARVLDPRPGERVLDLCAAPGAKTTHIAALMRNEGSVVAVERTRGRAEASQENCERLGASMVEVVVGRRRRAGSDRLRPCAGRPALLGPRHAPVAPGRALAQDRRAGR